jgi:hypothetical protein
LQSRCVVLPFILLTTAIYIKGMNSESFNRDFCDHLEYHLTCTFQNAYDNAIASLWCDGVLDPFVESQLTRKSVKDTRTIVTAAFIGNDGQDKYEMTIKFGPRSLSRYAHGAKMVDCIPSEESMDWITLDIENKKIEIHLY